MRTQLIHVEPKPWFRICLLRLVTLIKKYYRDDSSSNHRRSLYFLFHKKRKLCKLMERYQGQWTGFSSTFTWEIQCPPSLKILLLMEISNRCRCKTKPLTELVFTWQQPRRKTCPCRLPRTYIPGAHYSCLAPCSSLIHLANDSTVGCSGYQGIE